MKLHTTFVTFNRLELTKQAIESYLVTRSDGLPDLTYCVVDNGSTDGTAEWLIDLGAPVIWLNENRFPGKATNVGWSQEFVDADFLHRADNDHIFLPGWCEEVERAFRPKKVGQVGLRTAAEELNAMSNTGGNCVIRRELWDKGLRWDERTWPQLRDQVGPGITEDSLMSPAVIAMGYTWTRVKRPCIQPISSEHPDLDPDFPYYRQTWVDRGINENLYR